MICIHHQIFFGNEVKEDEMGGACSTDRKDTLFYLMFVALKDFLLLVSFHYYLVIVYQL
jgi:hypothetical protein